MCDILIFLVYYFVIIFVKCDILQRTVTSSAIVSEREREFRHNFAEIALHRILADLFNCICFRNLHTSLLNKINIQRLCIRNYSLG